MYRERFHYTDIVNYYKFIALFSRHMKNKNHLPGLIATPQSRGVKFLKEAAHIGTSSCTINFYGWLVRIWEQPLKSRRGNDRFKRKKNLEDLQDAFQALSGRLRDLMPSATLLDCCSKYVSNGWEFCVCGVVYLLGIFRWWDWVLARLSYAED